RFGLGWIRQLLPFQRSINVLLVDVCEPWPLNPTAHASECETAATPFSLFTAGDADTAAMLHVWHLLADEPSPAVTTKPQLKINARPAHTRQRARSIACPPALTVGWAGPHSGSRRLSPPNDALN